MGELFPLIPLGIMFGVWAWLFYTTRHSTKEPDSKGDGV